MPDPFDSRSDSVFAPSRNPFSISPDDEGGIVPLPKALYIGSGGDVTLRGVDGAADVVFRNVPDGSILDVRASHVRAAGTTASDIVGLA